MPQKYSKTRILLQLFIPLVVISLISISLGRFIFTDEHPGLISFALLHFLGYLFFIIMPVEALIPFYLLEGHSRLLLFILAVGTAMLAQSIDYLTGRLVSSRVINFLIGEKRYQRFQSRVENYGSAAVFFFNLFPLSSPIIVLFAGMLRLRFWKVLMVSFIGLSLKYLVLVLLF